MIEPLDKTAAFALIAADLECFIPLLATSDRADQLAAVRNIGDALLSANLTFRDLAARVAAPRPVALGSSAALALQPFQPVSGTQLPAAAQIDPAVVLSDVELQRLGGYRTGPVPSYGRYGYGSIPDQFETIPGESDERAGQRLAHWALAKSGQPFWEDPATGRGYRKRCGHPTFRHAA